MMYDEKRQPYTGGVDDLNDFGKQPYAESAEQDLASMFLTSLWSTIGEQQLSSLLVNA